MSLHPYSYAQLIAYATDQLGEAESSLIASHLSGCAECTTTVTRVRTIRAIMRDDDTEAPPPAAVARAIAIFSRSNGHAQRAGPFPTHVKENFRRTRRFSFAPILAAMVLALIIFFGVTQALVARAQDALPGDALYPVKTTFENVQLTLALDEASQTQVRLAIANERVTEITSLVDQGRYDKVPETVRDFENQIRAAATNLTAIDKQESGTAAQLAIEVDTALSNYNRVLTTLTHNGPEQVKPVIEHALSFSTTEMRQVQDQILSPPITRPTSTRSAPIDTPVPSAPPTVLPSSTRVPVASTTLITAPTSLPQSTLVPVMATSVPQSPTPQVSATPLPPSLLPATTTPLLQTATPVPATATRIPPIIIPVPPTGTPLPPPAATSLPPTTPAVARTVTPPTRDREREDKPAADPGPKHRHPLHDRD